MMDIMQKHEQLDIILKNKIIQSVYNGISENSICIAFIDGTYIDFKLIPKSEIKLQTKISL